MRIGSIGRGMVGEAIFQGFLSLGNEMTFYDPRFSESKMEDVLGSDIVIIAVPTLPNEKNECDLTILLKVLDDLQNLNYNGVICIKSTITPGTTQKMIEKYENDKICFCPEFLKERCAYKDFMEENPICIVGTTNQVAFDTIKEILKKGQGFLLQVKGNQKSLLKSCQITANNRKSIDESTSINKGHGRVEKRKVDIVSQLASKGYAMIDNFLDDTHLLHTYRSEAQGFYNRGEMFTSQSTRWSNSTNSIISYDKKNVLSFELKGGDDYVKVKSVRLLTNNVLEYLIHKFYVFFPLINLSS
jgi:hypothetical protein